MKILFKYLKNKFKILVLVDSVIKINNVVELVF